MSSDRLEYVPLSDLAEINPRKDVRLTGESTPVSFIPMGDVSESGAWFNRQTRPLGEVDSGYTSFKEGDVLFAKITPCMENGKGCHARNLENGHGFGSTEFHVLRSIEGVSDARFLYHWTRTPMLRLKAESAMSGSAGQQRVSTWFFDEFKIPHIPLSEQRRIADVLDTVDAAIQETDRVVEKQEQVKTGLLQDLLTRGLDADGRLRDPEREPEAFRETEMGRFPEGWQIFRLGEVAESAIDGPFGSKLKTSHYVDQPGVRVVRLQNIGNGVFDDADKAYVSREHARSLKRHKVVSGDLLVASLGDDTHPVGRACQYPDGHPPAINKADCFRVRVSPSLAVPRFVMHLLNCSYTREDIGGLVQGVTRDRINLTNLKRVRLPIPPIEEQERIVERIGRETDHIVAEKAYGGKLRHLKKGLMQDLLTGQVRVPEAEARVDEVGVFEQPPVGTAPVVYLAVESPGLVQLHEHLVATFESVSDGIEGESYVPHVTIARGGSVDTARRVAGEVDPIEWTVSELQFWDAKHSQSVSTVSLPA